MSAEAKQATHGGLGDRSSGSGSGQVKDVICMGCLDEQCNFQPMRFQRRALGPRDVYIEMKYCGICHTDLHTAAGHLDALGMKKYPCVPGHELAGVCVEVGSQVTKFQVGDHVGVGCMVDSCLNASCKGCSRGEEQFCAAQVGTYNGKPGMDRSAVVDGGNNPAHTLGGYTDFMVVDERFGIKIPKEYPLEYAGPVMCAGVTLFDPMRRYEAGPGSKVAIVGLGGLGVIGIKIAKAKGCIVTAISSSNGKREIAMRSGCDDYVVSSDSKEMERIKGSFDLVLNTIPANHDYTVYQRLVANHSTAKQVILGLNNGLVAGFAANLLCCNSHLVGSGIGSIESTQAVIDLCAEKKIFPEIEIIAAKDINRAYEQLEVNKTGNRFVIDIGNTLNAKTFEECAAVKPTQLSDKEPDSMTCCSIFCTICDVIWCCRGC